MTQLTSHLNMHIKDFFSHALEVHTRPYPGIELSEIVPVKAAYVTSTIVHAKWKEFSKQLFPTGFAGATGEPPPPIYPPLSLGGRPFSLRFPAHPRTPFSFSLLLSSLHNSDRHGGDRRALLRARAGSSSPWANATCRPAPPIHYRPITSSRRSSICCWPSSPRRRRRRASFWPKLDGPLSTTVPQYPLPQAAQDHLWQLLKAVPAEISKQQSTIASLLADLGSVFGLTQTFWQTLQPGN